MAQLPLAPPPPTKDNPTDRWLYQLWRRVSASGQLLAEQIDFTGSSITDLDLDGGTIDGMVIGDTTPAAGTFTTLTATGNTALGDAEATDTHAIKGATTILSNSASAALTVTNTGSGNAFVVEDVASDTTPFVIDATGNVVIGKATALSRLNVAATDNVPTTYPIRVDNSANNYGSGYGAYGMSNRVNVTNLSIDYTMDIGGALFIKTADALAVTVRVDGGVSIGGSGQVNSALTNQKPITGSTTAYANLTTGIVQPDVTSFAVGYRSYLGTAAAAFTLPSMAHFMASSAPLGAGSVIGTQHGFIAESSLTAATFNHGFYGNIPAGANRWNFFAGGTAVNAFNGPTRFGGVTVPTVACDVTGAVRATTSILSSGATAGVGYTTGAGGTVTQATSKATGVTLNRATGEITLHNASLAANTAVSFALTNSAIAATDHLVVSHVSGGTLGAYNCAAVSAAGSATIHLRNLTAGALAEAVVLKFTLIKAVTT